MLGHPEPYYLQCPDFITYLEKLQLVTHFIETLFFGLFIEDLFLTPGCRTIGLD